MVRCEVSVCKNYYERHRNEIKYFKFPKDKNLFHKWILLCNIDITEENDLNRLEKYGAVCSNHFVEEDYTFKDQLLGTPLMKRHLKEGACPSVNLELPEDFLQKEKDRKNIIEDLLKQSEKEEEEEDMCVMQAPIFKDTGMQTMVNFECALQRENKELRKENSQLKKMLKNYQELSKLQKNLSKIFTKGQIRKITTGNQRVNWNEEDLSSAISLYSLGPKSYRYMYKIGYPLPAPSTLRLWASQLQLRPGIILPVLKVMGALDFTKFERVCVVSFDEIKIKESFEYDKVLDRPLLPLKYAQMAMTRGLFKS